MLCSLDAANRAINVAFHAQRRYFHHPCIDCEQAPTQRFCAVYIDEQFQRFRRLKTTDDAHQRRENTHFGARRFLKIPRFRVDAVITG